MKTKRIIALMLLPLLLDVLIVSCCDCAPPENTIYTHCSLNIENLSNSGPKTEVSTENEISKHAFGIRLTISRKENICINQHLPLFSSSAYAFDCDCDRILFQPLDSIKSIEVFTVNDFDSTHLTGSNVSDYFRVYHSGGFYPIHEFIKNLDFEESNFLDTIQQFDLLLVRPPQIHIDHQFKVELELTDGRKLINFSSSIDLI